MSDPFDSPRLTILRAQHHINDLNARINEFINTQPWSYVVEQDLPARQDLHKIKFARRLPADLPSVVFDAANNLRAVLDQCGYASAVAAGKADPKRTQFPFGDDAAGLQSVIGRGRCKDLPPEILTLFCSFKPYQGGNDALWALNKLCNAKKHCALIPFDIGRAVLSISQFSKTPRVVRNGDVYELTYNWAESGFAGGMSVKNSDWDPVKYEFTLTRTPLGMRTDYKAHVSLSVAIDGVETQGRKPAATVLGEMMRIVDGILSATVAECRRLKLIK